jgi:tetratricopeptide (TPR) repeat protein
MDRFRRDAFEEAITLFERATLMNPAHHAAMESIGVCQERLGRLDDAVETMTGLADMDPENSMVWTNLSRYYGKQGKIQEAEDAKGKALYLSWKKQAGEQAVKKQAEVDEAARKETLEKRIGLFEQVLELDPEDVVANFGLGKIHLDLGDFEAAVPRFREAIRRQGDYSMAYNHLGTSLLALDRREEAVKVFREGIAVAAKRGDLMPMRDMERKLAGIEGEGG